MGTARLTIFQKYSSLLTQAHWNVWGHGDYSPPYTLLRICSTPTFPIFNLSRFEKEPFKLHKQMIPKIVALDICYIICQVQLCSCIRDCHATFFLKNTLFKQEIAWQPLRERQSCSLSIMGPYIRAFK